MTLAKPDFICYRPSGEVDKIFCKVCGVQIAGEVSELRGTRRNPEGVIVEEHTLAFRRFPTYAELKMVFEDGSFHVTNGCSRCLRLNLNPETLQDLYEADADEMRPALDLPPRKAKKALIVSTNQKGIT